MVYKCSFNPKIGKKVNHFFFFFFVSLFSFLFVLMDETTNRGDDHEREPWPTHLFDCCSGSFSFLLFFSFFFFSLCFCVFMILKEKKGGGCGLMIKNIWLSFHFEIHSFFLFSKGGASLCLWGFLCPLCLDLQGNRYSHDLSKITNDLENSSSSFEKLPENTMTESQFDRYPPWSCRGLCHSFTILLILVNCCCCCYGCVAGCERHGIDFRENFEYYCSSQKCCCCDDVSIEDCLIGCFCYCCSLIQVAMAVHERFRMNSKVEGDLNIKRARWKRKKRSIDKKRKGTVFGKTKNRLTERVLLLPQIQSDWQREISIETFSNLSLLLVLLFFLICEKEENKKSDKECKSLNHFLWTKTVIKTYTIQNSLHLLSLFFSSFKCFFLFLKRGEFFSFLVLSNFFLFFFFSFNEFLCFNYFKRKRRFDWWSKYFTFLFTSKFILFFVLKRGNQFVYVIFFNDPEGEGGNPFDFHFQNKQTCFSNWEIRERGKKCLNTKKILFFFFLNFLSSSLLLFFSSSLLLFFSSSLLLFFLFRTLFKRRILGYSENIDEDNVRIGTWLYANHSKKWHGELRIESSKLSNSNKKKIPNKLKQNSKNGKEKKGKKIKPADVDEYSDSIHFRKKRQMVMQVPSKLSKQNEQIKKKKVSFLLKEESLFFSENQNFRKKKTFCLQHYRKPQPSSY